MRLSLAHSTQQQENPRNPISKKATPVRLLEPSKPEQGYNPNHMYVRRPVHYSNLMIQVPTGDDKNPIWTSHIVRRNIRYDHNAGMFKWDRFAVYKDAEGNKIRKKIPWPKQKSSPLAQRADTVTISAVKEESWVPWDPKDPILLPSERPRDSPLSAAYVAQALDNRLKLQQEQNEYGVDDEVRTRTMTELKEALKSGDPKAITAALNAAAALQRSPSGARESSRGANSTYPGFQNRSRPKPIPVAQLPSPSELLQFKKDALQQWSRSSEVAAQIEQGGPTFAADDYLRLSPHAGPLVGNLWRSPITRTSSSYALVVQPPRNPATGQVIWDPTEYNEATSQRHLDSMPIELLMERDLTNPNNQKQRTKRYKERKEAQKQARLEQEDKNRENLALFRKYVQAKQQEREATEKAKEQAEAGAGRS